MEASWTWLELAEEWTRLRIPQRNVYLRRPGPDCYRGVRVRLGQWLLQETCNTRRQRWTDPTDLLQGNSEPLDVVSEKVLEDSAKVVTSRGAMPVRPASWVMRAS